MKENKLFLIILVCFLLLVGCGTKETKEPDKEERTPVRLREVTGDIVKAELDKNGNIVINKKDITTDAVYISYEYEGVTIGLIAVKDSHGDIKVVINTCQSCGGSPYAYFVQVGDKLQCQNCGNLFLIDELDALVPDGCNPIGITDRKDSKDTITIGIKQLQELKDKFINWKGPKA